ncbi:hypothetical protein TrRE_jg2528, partial [Triparma retinervis]
MTDNYSKYETDGYVVLPLMCTSTAFKKISLAALLNPLGSFIFKDRKTRSTTRTQSPYSGDVPKLMSIVTNTLTKSLHPDMLAEKSIISPVVLTSK